MGRKSLSLKLDGKEYKLRLTMHAMKELRQEYDDQPANIIMSAMSDVDKLCAVLEKALTWDGNENEVTDPEDFYDLLVDNGYGGQKAQGTLMVDLAENCGVFDKEMAKKVKETIESTMDEAFDNMEDMTKETAEEIKNKAAEAAGAPATTEVNPI